MRVVSVYLVCVCVCYSSAGGPVRGRGYGPMPCAVRGLLLPQAPGESTLYCQFLDNSPPGQFPSHHFSHPG